MVARDAEPTEVTALELYGAAMALRGDHDGSGEPVPPEEAAAIREVLERRIGPEWKPSLWPARSRADEALRAFVRAVLDETAPVVSRCGCPPSGDCERCRFP